MMNASSTIRFIGKHFAATLLGAALLVGSAHAGAAAEVAAIPVSAQVSVPATQAQDDGQDRPEATPAKAAQPSVGTVGFGWG